MPKYRYVGSVAYEVEEGEHKVPVAPGDFVDLTADDEKTDHNAAMIEEGLLVNVDEKKTTAKSKEGGE